MCVEAFSMVDHEGPLGGDHPLEAVVARAAESASARGWGPGWPNCNSGAMVGLVAGGVRITCRREISALMRLLLNETLRLGYVLIQSETGCFNCRPIASTRVPSNHSWGLAIDLNWNHNGFGYSVPHDIPAIVVALWKKYGFRWGGDYSGKKDYMHMEYMGTPASAEKDAARFVEDHKQVVTQQTWGRYLHPMVGAFWNEESNVKTGMCIIGADGGVFALGAAQFHGSAGGAPINKPMVGGCAHPSGNGYWTCASDGGVFSYGASRFFGSTGSITLNKPVVGMACTPSGNGYWLAAADGGVFAYGDAMFHGAVAQYPLNKPVVGIRATKSGKGYWLYAEDGGVFALGDAGYAPSALSKAAGRRVVGFAPTQSEWGYWLLCADGLIIPCGDAPDWKHNETSPYKATELLADDKGLLIVFEDGSIHQAGPGPVEFWGSAA